MSWQTTVVVVTLILVVGLIGVFDVRHPDVKDRGCITTLIVIAIVFGFCVAQVSHCMSSH
jgi:hypothetical protein